MKARIYVTLKPGVLDPQGKAVHHGLNSLGFSDVVDVRQGKFFEVSLKGTGPQARTELEQMCQKLLANPVIEEFRIEV